jgi:hypothetical protein
MFKLFKGFNVLKFSKYITYYYIYREREREPKTNNLTRTLKPDRQQAPHCTREKPSMWKVSGNTTRERCGPI